MRRIQIQMNDKASLLETTVVTKSSKRDIDIRDEGIRIFLNSPPIDNRANEECLKVLSKWLEIPKSNISIARGMKSRKKLFRIAGMDLDEVLRRLRARKPR
jgi:uncharacterized protein YggU (UPF0235/DUF167 family)